MLFIDNKGITDPAINLALEEYVLRNLPLNRRTSGRRASWEDGAAQHPRASRAQ